MIIKINVRYSPDNLTLANSHILDNSHNHYPHNCMFPHDSIGFDVWIIHTFCLIRKLFSCIFCTNHPGFTVSLHE